MAVCSIVSLPCLGTEAAAVPADDIPGGIVIHLGSANVGTLKALDADGRLTVQVLDRDAKRIADVRESVAAAGLSGPVSARVLTADRLPYADDLVNMVVAEDLMGLSEEEVLRVVRPLGQARIRSGGSWKTITKAWPDDIDEWTHFRHDPGGNPSRQG